MHVGAAPGPWGGCAGLRGAPRAQRPDRRHRHDDRRGHRVSGPGRRALPGAPPAALGGRGRPRGVRAALLGITCRCQVPQGRCVRHRSHRGVSPRVRGCHHHLSLSLALSHRCSRRTASSKPGSAVCDWLRLFSARPLPPERRRASLYAGCSSWRTARLWASTA